MVVTLDNAQELLRAGDVIVTSPVYPTKKKRRFVRLRKSITVRLSNGDVLTMAEGYQTDLSSSPWFLWGLLPPTGDMELAAIIHDWIYVHKTHSRKFADREMFIWSTVICRRWWDNFIRFVGVRLFGGLVWSGKMSID